MKTQLFSYLLINLVFSNVCILKAESAVDSLQMPTAGFIAEEFIYCSSEKILIHNTSFNFEEVFWQVEGDPHMNVLPNGDVELYFSETGAYDVQLVAVNDCGSDTLFRDNYIGVLKSPSVSISAELIESHCTLGETYDLKAISSDWITSYHWYPYGCQGEDTLAHCRQRFTFAPTGNEVGVFVTGENGCTGEAYRTIFPPHSQNVIIEAGINEFIVACQGEDFDESQLNIWCYPPECNLVIEELDTSTPGFGNGVIATGTYNNCTVTYGYEVPIASPHRFELTELTGCVGNTIRIDFIAGVAYEPLIYANGKPISSDFWSPFYFTPDSVGIYEITATENINDLFCISPDTLYLTVVDSFSVEVQHPEKFCRNIDENVIITAQPITGVPPFVYTWQVNAVPAFESESNVFTKPISQFPKLNNTIKVSVVDDNNCQTTEYEGKFTIDICDNIEDVLAASVKIYQSSSNELLLEANYFPIGGYQLRLFQLSGVKILEENIFVENPELEETIPIENLQSGIHFLQLEGENGELLHRKIWIEK